MLFDPFPGARDWDFDHGLLPIEFWAKKKLRKTKVKGKRSRKSTGEASEESEGGGRQAQARVIRRGGFEESQNTDTRTLKECAARNIVSTQDGDDDAEMLANLGRPC